VLDHCLREFGLVVSTRSSDVRDADCFVVHRFARKEVKEIELILSDIRSRMEERESRQET
jgi:hypothetical protein